MTPLPARRLALAFAFAAAMLSATALCRAQAAVTISTAATSNIVCTSGVCTPSKKNAVLNVMQLEDLLASGNVKVTTDGSKSSEIVVSAALSWASANALTLDAYQSITINKAVSVNGTGGLTLTTNDGGTGGALSFGPKGHVTFLSTTNSLTINGATYTLVADTPTLASDIAASPSGDFALASDYTVPSAAYPIQTTFNGVFEGLGNTISHLKNEGTPGGLFADIGTQGVVENLALTGESMANVSGIVGGLVDVNNGSLFRDHTTGGIGTFGGSFVGGLVGENAGQISGCYSSIRVTSKDDQHDNNISDIGGLVGSNESSGTISESYASGSVTAVKRGDIAGGLVGSFDGTITNSYATGAVSTQGGESGGLVGFNGGTIAYSYSTGAVSSAGGSSGGFIGSDSNFYPVTASYWDTTTSGITNPSQGAGNISNDPGTTGLSTTQLQAGLPAGFSSTIWGESASINGGLPYLLALPPT